MHRGEVVQRDRLLEALWGERPPETAPHALEVYVSKLRRMLGRELVETHGGGYSLALDGTDVDAARFELLVERGREELAHDAATAAATLREALSLWRGTPLADVTYEEFAQGEISRLEELRLIAVETRIEADLRLGRHAALVPELEALVREHPLRESLRAHLMLALYRSGRQADALAVFRDARDTLVDELGLEPSAELRQLETEILRHDATLDVEPAELQARRHLPAPPTPFIGRHEEAAVVTARFRDDRARLVTLVGPGGSGKTRLALKVAHDLAAAYTDGVYFVDLAPVRDFSFVEPTIAAALGLTDVTLLPDFLAQRRLLLVLDNFEHLQAAGPAVGALLRRAPGLSILMTSRKAMKVYGEHVFVVPPLSHADAEELFVARAIAAGAGRDRMSAIDELCEWLDRLPLAIELVAARARELPPSRILATLPGRLEVATAGPRDAPRRQRTLRTTIEWSHGLLTPREQLAFARIGVFAGSFTPETAQAVCDVALPDLAGLEAASLLVDVTMTGQEPRLTMLETIREYALERVEANVLEALQERHAAHFFSLALRAEPELERGSAQWHDLLELEAANLDAALDWYAEAGVGTDELRFAVALRRFWLIRGRALAGQRRLESALGRLGDARSGVRATALGAAAQLALSRSDYATAKRLTQESLELARSIDEGRVVALSLNRLGDIAKAEGDFYAAERHYAAALAIAREHEDDHVIAAILTNAGSFFLLVGDIEQAEAHTRDALAMWTQLGNHEGEQVTIYNLAVLAVERDAWDQALPYLQRAFELGRRLGFKAATAAAIGLCATIAAERGDSGRAVTLIAAMDDLLDAVNATASPHASRKRDEALRKALGQLTPDEIAAAREAHQALSEDEVVTYALDSFEPAVRP